MAKKGRAQKRIKKFQSVSRGRLTLELASGPQTMIHQHKKCTPFTVIYSCNFDLKQSKVA